MTELQLTLTPKESSEESELKKVIANKLKIHINEISHIQLVKNPSIREVDNHLYCSKYAYF